MDNLSQAMEASQVSETTTPNLETTENAQAVNASEQSQAAATEEAAASKGISGIKQKIAKAAAGDALSKEAAYQPNFKFKVLDQEQEFDELLRPLIKSKDVEEKIRELYSKGFGIEHIKGERQKFREELETLKPQYESLNKGLDQLSNMLGKKDYLGFFNALKIPEEDILQYALSRVQYKEMPPEQRQQLDAQYQEKQRLEYLEQTNQQLLEMYQNQAVHQRTSELDGYLGKPDIQATASAFDARVGQPGAFRDEVIRRGQYHASISGQDIPVEQAVREVMALIGNATPAPQMQAAAVNPATVAAQQNKPVIPNIKGRGTSPAKKAISSISDLRKYAADFAE
jgi:hypothetical protein